MTTTEIVGIILAFVLGGTTLILALEIYFNTKSKWIKVEDKLPEVNETVFLYSDKGLKFVGRLSGDNEWYVGDSISSWSFHAFDEWLGRITHWMPFPDGPNKEVK